MPCTSSPRILLLLLVPVLLFPVLGCTSEQAEDAQEEQRSNLLALVPILRAYVNTHGGRYPGSEEDLRKFIESRGENPEAVLVSSRDGQPLGIVYQAERGKVQRNIMAYEREGKDGTRMVIDELGIITPLSEQEFQQAVPEAVRK